MLSKRRVVLAVAIALAGCKTESNATPASSSSSSSPSSSSAVLATEDRAFHYDLVLTTTEGTASTRTAFTLDVSTVFPGAVTIGKNVVLPNKNRVDVGANVKAKLTMEKEEPRLDVELTMSWADVTGKRHTAKPHNAAVTPPGKATDVIDATEDGRHIKLTATPTPSASLGALTADGAHVVDVSIAQTGAVTKNTSLMLNIAGAAPATANTGENIPLGAGDGGIMQARQDTGARVKASARSRKGGLELDLDIEVTAAEGGAPATIRRITSRAPVLAPFDKSATAFTVEEDGQRYEVKVTAHR